MMKKILNVIGGIALVLLIVPMFLSSKFSMTKSIEIQAPSRLSFQN